MLIKIVWNAFKRDVRNSLNSINEYNLFYFIMVFYYLSAN